MRRYHWIALGFLVLYGLKFLYGTNVAHHWLGVPGYVR